MHYWLNTVRFPKQDESFPVHHRGDNTACSPVPGAFEHNIMERNIVGNASVFRRSDSIRHDGASAEVILVSVGQIGSVDDACREGRHEPERLVVPFHPLAAALHETAERETDAIQDDAVVAGSRAPSGVTVGNVVERMVARHMVAGRAGIVNGLGHGR